MIYAMRCDVMRCDAHRRVKEGLDSVQVKIYIFFLMVIKYYLCMRICLLLVVAHQYVRYNVSF